MIAIYIPGFRRLELSHLVCDYNGTLAFDGTLLDDVADRIAQLAERVEIHVITGDTFGTAQAQIEGLRCELVVLPARNQAEAKQRYVEELGAQHVVAVGNGRNDRLMLAASALGIGVCGGEGMAGEAAQAADIVVHDVHDALDLLLSTTRLVASLRS